MKILKNFFSTIATSLVTVKNIAVVEPKPEKAAGTNKQPVALDAADNLPNFERPVTLSEDAIRQAQILKISTKEIDAVLTHGDIRQDQCVRRYHVPAKREKMLRDYLGCDFDKKSLAIVVVESIQGHQVCEVYFDRKVKQDRTNAKQFHRHGNHLRRRGIGGRSVKSIPAATLPPTTNQYRHQPFGEKP